MSAISRQNTLLVAEDWVKIYEALSASNIDFRAYDQAQLVQALFNYLKLNYAEQFNDWIGSSEFVTKVEILAWLSQNLAFRTELNSRENFLATAERRDSLLKLAQNIGYKVNRVRSANGVVKINSIRTTQSIVDSNGIDLQNRSVIWNDPRDEDWFERFTLIMNKAFINRTQFGNPLVSNTTDGITTEQYRFNSAAPLTGAYQFNAMVNGDTLPFDMFNYSLDSTTGTLTELSPNPNNSWHVLYKVDGSGFSSHNTGFFFPFVQGNLRHQDNIFTDSKVLRLFDLNVTNANNDDFFVQTLDANGGVLFDWTKVDTIFGEGVSFNTLSNQVSNIYELDTLNNDDVRVKFGDGSFGAIPTGTMRFWYRTANPTPSQITPEDITNQTLTIPYVSDNNLYQITFQYNLETTINNGTATESNFDIRTRVGKVFYTQNRMVNAQDYNNFYLKDNSIRKVKTVNRTFTGQSRYGRLTDPTSLYQNVTQTAEDGRLYAMPSSNNTTYTADTVRLPAVSLITKHIAPLIRQMDKVVMYQNKYTEIPFTTTYTWSETSITNNQSMGNILSGGAALPVGSSATNTLKYLTTGSILRTTGTTGATIQVDRVTNSGTAANEIILKGTIANGISIYGVLPALRNTFTETELIELNTRLGYALTFGIGWDQTNSKWVFINNDNMNTVSEFSLANQGDTTGNSMDASWMILCEYKSTTNGNIWSITDRGMTLNFESARAIDFVFANNKPVTNPENGRLVMDTIKILGNNESRDSQRRRNSNLFRYLPCGLQSYIMTGDGSTTNFVIDRPALDANHTFVLVDGKYQLPDIDYTISNISGVFSIVFTVAPIAGSTIVVYVTSSFAHGVRSVTFSVGDGIAEEFALTAPNVRSNNTLAYIDSVMQVSNLDFGIGQVGNNSSIVYSMILPAGDTGTAYVIEGIDNNVFTKTNYIADGTTTAYAIPVMNQNSDSTIVIMNGITQAMSNYTVSNQLTGSVITFTTAPPVGVRIRILSVVNTLQTITNQYQFAGDGTTSLFTLTNNKALPTNGEWVIVTLNGVLQYGPWATTPAWSVTNDNQILLATPPSTGDVVQIFYLAGTLGSVGITDPNSVTLLPLTSTNNIDSCLVNYLGSSVSFTPTDVLRHPDGYVNKNGLTVAPIDANIDGAIDNPFIFRELVLQDKTDLVLWRKITEFGFGVFDPINMNTIPRGDYGSSVANGTTLDTTKYSVGDIFYDTVNASWLIADVSNVWKTAADQSQYQYAIGRDGINFIWTHYAPDANKIDPSKSNIMNVYILSSGYDTSYRNWLAQNITTSEPVPETSDQLRVQFSSYDEFKPISDAIIYYPIRYQPLFGKQAISELQATIKIIQTNGSTLSESDLKLNVLSAIDLYFSVDRWDLGESFYFTELVAFVHAQVAPDLQSMVIVPKNNNQAFGRLFQVRSESDKLFISSASPEDISVVKYFTDSELKIGALI